MCRICPIGRFVVVVVVVVVAVVVIAVVLVLGGVVVPVMPSYRDAIVLNVLELVVTRRDACSLLPSLVLRGGWLYRIWYRGSYLTQNERTKERKRIDFPKARQPSLLSP
jgi:hypothetical protein